MVITGSYSLHTCLSLNTICRSKSCPMAPPDIPSRHWCHLLTSETFLRTSCWPFLVLPLWDNVLTTGCYVPHLQDVFRALYLCWILRLPEMLCGPCLWPILVLFPDMELSLPLSNDPGFLGCFIALAVMVSSFTTHDTQFSSAGRAVAKSEYGFSLIALFSNYIYIHFISFLLSLSPQGLKLNSRLPFFDPFSVARPF